MNGMNRATLVGNLTADPELRYTQSGTAVLNVRMATNEKYKKDEEWVDRVDYHNIVIWGKRGEGLAKILAKGSPVLIEGGIRTSSYEKDGTKFYKTEIHATEVLLLGGKRGEAVTESDRATDDEIPF